MSAVAMGATIPSGGIDDKISQQFFSGRYSVKILIYARV